jgi:hypothetical protein
LLSSEEGKSERIENILAKFNEMGINVIKAMETESGNEPAIQEGAEEETESENALVEVERRPVPTKFAAKELAERTSDPVGIYLRGRNRHRQAPRGRP